MDITFGSINSTVTKAAETQESNLQSQLTAVSQKSDPTAEDLLGVQTSLQQWTVMIQVATTVNKELGDALKGIVQKAD
jgi:type III secretion protein F